MSTCRGVSRGNDDCAKLYNCGRPPSLPPASVSSSYFRRGANNEYDDDEDRLLFPGLMQSNSGPTANGARFQKAAIVYEFSCSGIDCPPSAISDPTAPGNCCDLLSQSKDNDHQTDTSIVTSAGSPTGTADEGHQLIDLCRRPATYAVQPAPCDISCRHHCIVRPINGHTSPIPDGGSDYCASTTSSANDYVCSTMTSRLRGARRFDTSGNSSSPFEMNNYQQQQQQQQQCRKRLLFALSLAF